MRVALVYPFYRSAGGIERYLREVAGILSGSCDLVLVSTEDAPDGNLFSSAVQVRAPHRPSGFLSLTFALAARRRLRRLSVDVVHVQGASAFRQDIVHAHSCHKAWFRTSLRELPWRSRHKWLKLLNPLHHVTIAIESIQYRPANHRKVVAISHTVARDLMQWYRVAPERIEVIYNGVNCELFTPENRETLRDHTRARLDIPSDRLCALFVANEFGRKGLSTALEAVAALGSDDVGLVVVGRDDPARYTRLARQLGISEHVTFAGAHGDLRPYYAAADVFVLPTRHDAFGLVITEAMAAGLPVIVTSEAGAAELITHGEDGYVLDDPRSADAFAACLQELLDEARRDEMGRKARATAERHSWAASCRQLLDLYRVLAPEES
jgi:UDP-glucose:(heptosyl)LPS alpha-1,3-glucosyltransferase